VDLNVTTDTSLGAYEFEITFDPTLVTYVSYTSVPTFISSTGRSVLCVPQVVPTPTPPGVPVAPSSIRIGCATFGSGPGPTGSGLLGMVLFQANSFNLGTSPLSLTLVGMADELGNDFIGFYNGTVTGTGASVDVIANNGTPLPTFTVTNTPTITPTPTNTTIATPTPTGIAPPGTCGPQIAVAVCFDPSSAAANVGAPLAANIRVEDVANFGAFEVTVLYPDFAFANPPTFTEGPFLAVWAARRSACRRSSRRAPYWTRPRSPRNASRSAPRLRAWPAAASSAPSRSSPTGEGSTALNIIDAVLLDVPANLIPAGYTETMDLIIGPQPTATPCPGVCPTDTPTPSSTATPTATATATGTNTPRRARRQLPAAACVPRQPIPRHRPALPRRRRLPRLPQSVFNR